MDKKYLIIDLNSIKWRLTGPNTTKKTKQQTPPNKQTKIPSLNKTLVRKKKKKLL
jgi:hypothetical protein